MILSNGKKFISPGAWFSIIYPENWNEFEDTESSFLFYDPVNWTGNFRISAFKDDPGRPGSVNFGKKSMETELKNNPGASQIKLGAYDAAYSKEMFQENGAYYVTHLWIFGIENLAFEASFTVQKGVDAAVAQEILSTVEIRKDNVKYPAEIIPVRLMEIFTINESYEFVAQELKKLLKKDFQAQEEDLPAIEKLIDGDFYKPKQKDAWLSLGIAVCLILANEIEGMEWMTLIDGNREAPVLQYKSPEKIIDPMKLVWSKIKAGQPCHVKEEYNQIIESL